MFKIENFKEKILIHLFIDFLICTIQVMLIFFYYNEHKLDFRYLYYGAIFMAIFAILKSSYLLVLVLKAIFTRKYILGFGIMLYLLILLILFLTIATLSVLPVVGVTSK